MAFISNPTVGGDKWILAVTGANNQKNTIIWTSGYSLFYCILETITQTGTTTPITDTNVLTTNINTQIPNPPDILYVSDRKIELVNSPTLSIYIRSIKTGSCRYVLDRVTT